MAELKPRALKPFKPAPPITPQCEAMVDPPTHANMWRRDRYLKLRPHMDPDKCQRESAIEIEGKAYCRLHAGGIALERWLNGDLVTRK